QNVITYPVVATVDNDDETLLPGMTVNAEIQISRRDNVLRVPNAALRFRPADVPADTSASPQARGAGSMLTDEIPGIATTLHLDATQQAAFDKAMAAVRERAQEQRAKRASAQTTQAPPSTLFGGGRGNSGSNAGGQGSSRGGAQMAQRMLARINQQFAEFHATLNPDQQQSWDSALQALGTQKSATVWKLVAGKPQEAAIRVGASDGSFTEVVGGALAVGDKAIIGAVAPDATKQ
ncbi:MAG: Spy/CpxP family protein refolding chaperone, partial [Lysobacteraceae bacterium]